MKKIFNIVTYFFIALIFIVIIYSPKNTISDNGLGSSVINENDIISNENSEAQNSQSENEGEQQEDTYVSGEFIYTDNGIRVQALVNLNVREQPAGDSTKVGMLYMTDIAAYIDTYNNSWYKVLYDDKIAYVSANGTYSKLVDYNNLQKNEVIIDTVIETGIELLATPYQFGAQRILLWNGSLNSSFTGKTYDCSSFIQYIYYQGAGVKLSGDSRSQSKNGTNIEHSKIQRGDILVMTSTSRQYNTGIERIGHVALYLGNNKILHTFGTGGVRIQDYSEFWKGRFIIARRII